MAFSFVNSTTTTTAGATSVTINVPASVQNGDLLVLVVNGYITTSLTRPAGFTGLKSGAAPLLANHFYDVSYRVASSEPASYTVNYGSASSWSGLIMYAIRGATITPVANSYAKVDASAYVTALPDATGSIASTSDGTIYIYGGVNSGAIGLVTFSGLSGSLLNGVTVTDTNSGSGLWVGWAVDLVTPGGATASSGLDYEDFLIDITLSSSASYYSSVPRGKGPFGQGPFLALGQQFGGPPGPVANTLSLAAALSFVGGQSNATSRTTTGALGFSGSQAKASTRKLPGVLSFTGTQGPRAVGRALAANLSFTGGQSKSVLRPVSAALSFTGSLPRATARALSGVLSSAGAITRRGGKSLSATLGFTGVQSKATTRTLPSTLSFSGTANKAVQRTLSGALSFVGNASRAVTRGLLGGLSFSGAVTSSRTRLQNLVATLSFSGAVQKSTTRPLGASLSPSGAMSKAMARLLPSAALGFAGGLTRNIGKQVLGALTFVGSFVANKIVDLLQTVHILGPPVSGQVVAVIVVQLPGGPAIFYLLSYIPDEVPIGEVATFRVQLAGSDGSRPAPDLAPVMRVLDSTGGTALANTTMTNSGGVWAAPWTPSIAGAFSVEVRTALSSNTIAAQIPVTVRPRFDPIALAVSDTLVSRM